MDGFGLRFDHFGLATREPELTLAFLRALGYQTHDPIHDPLQRVDLVLCRSSTMPAVEVISSADAANPLISILAAQPQAIYHLCYRSENVSASLAAIKAAGHRVLRVSEPKPAVLFGHQEVSFHMVRGFGLIEIIQTCE